MCSPIWNQAHRPPSTLYEACHMHLATRSTTTLQHVRRNNHTSSDYLADARAAPTVCYDRHQRCMMWARQGLCEAHPGYMTTYCRLSCGHCNLDSEHYCYNHDTNCNWFAREGKCKTDREFMEASCPQICNFCSE